jgi:hypothetical protein
MSKPQYDPHYQGEMVMTHGGAALQQEYGSPCVAFNAEVYRAELLPHPEGGLRLQWQRYAYWAVVDVDDMWNLAETGQIPLHKLSRRPARDHKTEQWEFAGCGEFLHTALDTSCHIPEEQAVYQALRVGYGRVIGTTPYTPEMVAQVEKRAQEICDEIAENEIMPRFDHSVEVDPEDPTAVVVKLMPRGLLCQG